MMFRLLFSLSTLTYCLSGMSVCCAEDDRIIAVGGLPSRWRKNFTHDDRVMAYIADGQKLIFPSLESLRPPIFEFHVCERFGETPNDHRRLVAGMQDSIIGTGPKGMIMFYNYDPLNETVAKPLDDGTQYMEPVGYICTTWVGSEHFVYYRMPRMFPCKSTGTSSMIYAIWVGEHPTRGDACLFATVYGSRLYVWPLHNEGNPPTKEEVRIEELPQEIDLQKLLPSQGTDRSAADDADNGLVFTVADNAHALLLAREGENAIFYVSLAHTDRPVVHRLDIDADTPPYHRLGISPNGRACAGVRFHRRDIGPAHGKAPRNALNVNTLDVWDIGAHKLLWTHTIADDWFFMREELSPNSTYILAWSREVPDESSNSSEKNTHAKGMLELFDVQSGEKLFTKTSKELGFWPIATAISPDETEIALLEQRGKCHFLHMEKLTNTH